MRTRTTHKDSSIFYAESPVRETSRLSDSNSPSVSIFDPSPANSYINGFGGNELSRSQLRNESPVSAEYARRSNHTDFRQVHTSQKKDTSIFNIFSVNGVDSNESPRGIAQFAPKLNAQTLFAFGVSGLRHIWYTIRPAITAFVSILNLRILKLFFLRLIPSQMPLPTTATPSKTMRNSATGKLSRTHGLLLPQIFSNSRLDQWSAP